MRKCPNCGENTEFNICGNCGFDLTKTCDEKNATNKKQSGIDSSFKDTNNLNNKFRNNGYMDDGSKALGIVVDNAKETKAGISNALKSSSTEQKCSIVALLFSCFFVLRGFYKIHVYDNLGDSVNAYVGGDAYNYIINSNYATAYFVLAGSLLIASILLHILHEIKSK